MGGRSSSSSTGWSGWRRRLICGWLGIVGPDHHQWPWSGFDLSNLILPSSNSLGDEIWFEYEIYLGLGLSVNFWDDGSIIDTREEDGNKTSGGTKRRRYLKTLSFKQIQKQNISTVFSSKITESSFHVDLSFWVDHIHHLFEIQNTVHQQINTKDEAIIFRIVWSSLSYSRSYS